MMPDPVSHGTVTLSHGAGGRAMRGLVQAFLRALGDAASVEMDDAAVLETAILEDLGGRVAFAADSFTADPPFFPGGDIGKLAIFGTANDLAMMGARPIAMAVCLVLTEGFSVKDLESIAASMGWAASQLGIPVVTGDTKVLPHSGGEDPEGPGIIISTSAIGLIRHPVRLSGRGAKADDKIIISGPIGEHEAAMLVARGGLGITAGIRSDCRPLWPVVKGVLDSTFLDSTFDAGRTGGRLRSRKRGRSQSLGRPRNHDGLQNPGISSNGLHVFRDPTRGGLASALKEIAEDSGVAMVIEEERIPMNPEVKALADILGLDPLYMACEGRMVAIADPALADIVVEAMRKDGDSKDAAIIGRVLAPAARPDGSPASRREDPVPDEEALPPGGVLLLTRAGGKRLLDLASGESLPRIC